MSGAVVSRAQAGRAASLHLYVRGSLSLYRAFLPREFRPPSFTLLPHSRYPNLPYLPLVLSRTTENIMDVENVYDSTCPLFYLNPEDHVEVIGRRWPEKCTGEVSGCVGRECPEDDHGFNLIPFQTKVECSEHCVVLVSFLVREAPGYHHSPPPPGQLQDWVRKSLQVYAPLFTRIITAIPVELIPPGSHISNIDMRIEVRLAAIDFKKDEAVFKLDNTSARKLEVFYTELVGKEPGADLTEKLSKLRVRMAMVGVIGDELLGFQEVVGGVFDIDDWHARVSYKEVQHESDTFDTVQEEWASFCQSLREHQVGRYLPTQYEASPDDWGSLQAAAGGRSDDGQLETFPEDGSTSPQAYWAPKPMRVVMPQQQIIEGPNELAERVQQDNSNCSREQGGNKASSTPTSPNPSHADISRGTPKAYGDLGYNKPARVPHIPPTPTLVSCVDPQSPSVFILPEPVTLRSSLSDRETRREFPDSPVSLRTNISTVATNGSVEGSEQDSTPPLSSRTSSTDSENEVTSPSSVSTHTHLPIYDAFPRVRLASDTDPIIFSPHSPMWEDDAFPDGGQWKKLNGMEFATIEGQWMDKNQGTGFAENLSEAPPSEDVGYECHLQHLVDIEAEDLDEYGFELDDEVEFTPLQTKAEKDVDPTAVIIQGRMEAMLDAAESQGYVYQATRDGLDNHPISVRLRSISGDYSSMADILGERRYSSVAYDNTTNARATGLAAHQNARSRSPPLFPETIDILKTTSSGYLPPMTSNHCAGSTTTSTFPLDTPSSHNLKHIQPSNRNFCEYKAGVKSRTDRLKEMKLQFEHEGELMLGAYHRTLKRIQILEMEILRFGSEEERTLENKAREMIEFCGYDESAFTQETNLASPTGKSTETFMEGCITQKDLQASTVTGGEGRVEFDAGIIDGAQSKTDWKGPLKVRTNFCENSAELKEISPCCQFGTRAKGAYLEEPNVKCAHGMMQVVKPIPSFSSTDTSPIGGAEPWKVNYTVGGQCGRRIRAYQEDCVEFKSNAPCGMSVSGGSHPAWRTFSSTDVPQPIGKQFSAGYSQTSTIFSPESWTVQQSVDINTPVTKSYSDKITEYYQSTRGDAAQRGGRASSEAVSSIAKENIGTGKERNWQEPLEMGLYAY
ncbi:hypothetical protein EV426DRAFT_575178 [Tirmania nivea]|nr:hypothetical protein EV426DRAFT_575178 [Tirmania nivea]